MQNKDKSMKQKVAEYMEILGVRVPDDQDEKTDNPDEDTARQSTGSVV